MGRLGSTTSRRARQMRRVLTRWERSGLKLREFGERHGIPLSSEYADLVAASLPEGRRASERGVQVRDVITRVSTHPARLVLELRPREWKRLRQDSVAQAAA